MKRIETAWLTVHPENAGAVRLYRRFGFETMGEEAAYFGPGEPRLRMERRRLRGEAERAR